MTAIRMVKTSRLIYFAIGLGFIALLSSFSIIYFVYANSISTAEKELYKFYSDKATLIHSFIEVNSDKSPEELLKLIEGSYILSDGHPEDEYVCIVDGSSNLILHTKHPETVGLNAGRNKLLGENDNQCSLNDLVLAKKDYVGNYISSSGEKQIAAFEYVESLNWTIGVHRAKEQLLKEIKLQYRWFLIAFLIISGILLPLSLVILFRISKSSHKREMRIKIESQERLEKNNELLRSAKEQIERSENKFRSLVETTSDWIWEIDALGNFIYASPKVEDLLGYKPKELIGKNAFDLMSPEEAERVDKVYSKFVENKEAFSGMINVNLHKNGNEVIIESNGEPVFNKDGGLAGYRGIDRDITERKKVEIELKEAKEKAEENERKLQAIFDVLPIGISIIKNDYTISQVNKSLEKIIKLKFSDLTSNKHHNRKYLRSNGTEMPQEEFASSLAIKENRTIENIEMGIVLEDNSIVWTSVSATPLKFADYSAVIAVVDITERKKYEFELKAAKEKAEESDSLKLAFLQNMSHEIRTPLNAISGFSGLLVKKELSTEKLKDFVSVIQNSSTQLVSIVSDILTMSSLETKQERVNIEPVCINCIIDDLLAIFKQQALNKNVSLRSSLNNTDRPFLIYTDKTKVTQVISNLLTNALKFTHKGFVEFGYELKDGDIEFYVKDSGIGIEPSLHEKIFERFWQVDISKNRKYGGTGLGLSISKAFVELLGGKIWVNSVFNKGSEFYFTIPYKKVEDELNTKVHANSNLGSGTVLVAEDEEFNYSLIEEMLADSNLQLIHAKNGQETIDVFKENSGIDLILMDIKMPVLNGHDAAQLIKEIRPDIPIIAQSAYALENEVKQYKEVFDDYITKPFSEDLLLQKITKFLGKKLRA